MKLSVLLSGMNIDLPGADVEISEIVFDSRKATPGCAFVCIVGSASDGHIYAKKAEEAGAAAIIAQRDLAGLNVPIVRVNDTKIALAQMSANFFKNPSQNDIIVVGITGTKGKTTTAFMLKSILESAGYHTGIIGTIGVLIGDRVIKTNNTTPSSLEVQGYLRKMADEGCKYCVMEVSSIGLKEKRVNRVFFKAGVFTNFSHDHIGGVEHKDMKEYMECKSILFKMCEYGIINIDDENYEGIINGHSCNIFTYGFSPKSQLRGMNYKLLSYSGFLGSSLDITGDMKLRVKVSIPGEFNAYNALAAVACCRILGVNEESIRSGLKSVNVKGRVEMVPLSGDFVLLIDYAHNAVSMENLLNMLRQYNPKRLVCMFGAGGDRPKVRRYEMGEVCGRLADLSVITTDNPRFEDPLEIIEDIRLRVEENGGSYVIVPDRREAIKYCIENAVAGDIVVLAGKGHEDYQEIKGVKFPMDERVIIADITEGRF